MLLLLAWERTRGYAFANGRALGQDNIGAKWPQSYDFSDAEHRSTVTNGHETQHHAERVASL